MDASQTTTFRAPGLSRKIGLAWAALAWESLWPRLVPVLSFVALFIAAAHLDRLARYGGAVSPEMPSKPDCVLSSVSTSEGDIPSFRAMTLTIAGSMSPERVPITRPSRGVIPMEVSTEELCAAVRAVAAGLIVGARELLLRPEDVNLAPSPLTGREVEILGMLSRGLANKQIAVQLGISEHTVKFHVSSIYTKLNVANRTEAVHQGLRNGWIAL